MEIAKNQGAIPTSKTNSPAGGYNSSSAQIGARAVIAPTGGNTGPSSALVPTLNNAIPKVSPIKAAPISTYNPANGGHPPGTILSTPSIYTPLADPPKPPDKTSWAASIIDRFDSLWGSV